MVLVLVKLKNFLPPTAAVDLMAKKKYCGNEFEEISSMPKALLIERSEIRKSASNLFLSCFILVIGSVAAECDLEEEIPSSTTISVSVEVYQCSFRISCRTFGSQPRAASP